MDTPAMTTDQIADGIRQRIAAHPAVVITCWPAVDQLTAMLTQQLPYIAADDVGAVLMNISSYLVSAMQLMRGPGGLSAHAASEMAANIIALTGERLYAQGQQAAKEQRNGGPKAGGR